MTSIEKKTTREEILHSFFSYWDNLEIIRELEKKSFKKINENSIRAHIISILSMGIEDEDPYTGESKIRHVLSAAEISKRLESEYDIKIKKSNLYFHISALEEINAITMVDQIPTGKRYTSYFARTAKVFYPLRDEEDEEETKRRMRNYSPLHEHDVKELICRMNPDKSEEEIDRIIQKANGINNYNHQLLREWLNCNQKFTEGLDINYVKFYSFLSILDRYNEETVKGLVELAKLLRLDKLKSKKDKQK